MPQCRIVVTGVCAVTFDPRSAKRVGRRHAQEIVIRCFVEGRCRIRSVLGRWHDCGRSAVGPSPNSCLSRRTSLILRMDNLLLGKPILRFRGRLTCPYCCPAPPRGRARKHSAPNRSAFRNAQKVIGFAPERRSASVGNADRIQNGIVIGFRAER